MPNKYPFAVRLIGFDDQETARLALTLADERQQSHGYFHLQDDNLQDPDLFIANAEDLKALARLSYLSPSDVRPALLLGTPIVDLPYACLAKPFEGTQLLAALDALVEKRADALVRLQASAVVTVPERRRRERLDLDLTDPAEYLRMRRQPVNGGVLVVDKAAMLRDFLASVLARQKLAVGLVSDAIAASEYCERHPVSVVLINTSTPGIDPYALCQTIKRRNSMRQTSVILLTGKSFTYDAFKARCAGSDGFLTKPLASHHLLSALKKFLPQGR